VFSAQTRLGAGYDPHMQVLAMPVVVQELAVELLPAIAEYGEGMTDHLVAMIPELAGDDDLRAETRASCEANVGQVLRLLKAGSGAEALFAPPEAVELMRALVRRGITVAALLRTYRLGHAWLWDRWSQALNDRIDEQDALDAARDLSSAFMFAYVDRVSDILVEEYGTERERGMRGAAQLRADTVRTLLAGDPIDEEVAVSRLGYELRRQHLALRISSVSSEIRGLERAATEAASALGPGEPLIVESGVATIDVWLGSYDDIDTGGLAAYEPPGGIRVAFGVPGHGVAGFRRSHAEAVHAGRVAALAADGRPVTDYRAIELVSLLATDLPRARAFVASRLGPLAADEEPAQRLRETVLAFLSAGGSSTRAAKELYVHQNTVAYRVKRAEELLGRRVTESPVELTCALTLTAVLGSAVLAQHGGDDAGD
jgi:DNA-binding PucR family transcriptional regulator